MELQPYRSEDCAAMAELFHRAVHATTDYTPKQRQAWANGSVDLAAWDASFRAHTTLVAKEGEALVGFGDMEEGGYLDRLYVHPKYQRRGIATALVQALEQSAMAKGVGGFTTHASITAKPFFQAMGYETVGENQVVRQGVTLTNFTMKKAVKTGDLA